MADLARDRSRLIDHFKRLYSIIVGLAITEGCRKLLPFDAAHFSFPSLWMFCAFLVTVVPLFQGGDRSLDLKYLDEPEAGREYTRFAYLWDVYMLLVTGLLMTFVAEAIPPARSDAMPMPEPDTFFALMGFLLSFDVFVLLIDLIKSHVSDRLETYYPWILMNAALAVVCVFARHLHEAHPNLSLSRIAFAVFVFAFLRTTLDYALSESFMFPLSKAHDPQRTSGTPSS